MRDKLIELMQEWSLKNNRRFPFEDIVDHLLANGVIVLQCKVGDTVYQTDGVRIYELEVFDVGLKNYRPYYETESIDFDDRAIGKTVFLTREEAEKALAERSENEHRTDN